MSRVGVAFALRHHGERFVALLVRPDPLIVTSARSEAIQVAMAARISSAALLHEVAPREITSVWSAIRQNPGAAQISSLGICDCASIGVDRHDIGRRRLEPSFEGSELPGAALGGAP
jgi:hypothetical protein